MLSDARDRLTTALSNDVGLPMSSPVPAAASNMLRSPLSLLERLPAELRNEIYKLLFRGKICPAIRTTGKSRWTARATKKRFGNGNVISILQTCRLFRSEAKWMFKQEVVVAFTPRGLAIAAVMLASTMLDMMDLRQISLVNDRYDPAMLAAVRVACPRLEAIHLALCDARSDFPAPLRTLIDPRDSDPGKISQSKPKRRAVFLSIVRYDWLFESNVAEFTNAVSDKDFSGPRVLFSSSVIFEQRPRRDLAHESDGGVGFHPDPNLLPADAYPVLNPRPEAEDCEVGVRGFVHQRELQFQV